MRSIFFRLAIAGVAAVLAASAGVPASAAPHHKRVPAQAETVTQPAAVHPTQSNVPSIFNRNNCISDEGYGRYAYCDQGSL